jgi:chaperonin GroEL
MVKQSKNLSFNTDGMAQLLAGAKKMYNAVGRTLGPNGSLVVMENSIGMPVITKDGVSIASEMYLSDPFENMGAQMLKQASIRTGMEVGDGTTTSIVLAYKMMDSIFNLISKKIERGERVQPISVKDGILIASEKALESLKLQTVQPTGKDIINVAVVSANNDALVGGIVADAIDKAGDPMAVTVLTSATDNTYFTVIEGMQIPSGFISPYFVTDPDKFECALDDCYILAYDNKIEDVRPLIPLLDAVTKTGKPLLIIADDVEGTILNMLTVNHLNGKIKVCIIKSPGIGPSKIAKLEDIAIYTSGEVANKDKGKGLLDMSIEMLGHADRIIVDKERTLIIGGKGGDINIGARLTELKAQLEVKGLDQQMDIQNRINMLAGKASMIFVGGSSDVELREKKDRVDDSICSVKAALKSGILPGGGSALYKASKDVMEWREKCVNSEDKDFISGINFVIDAMSVPFELITEGYDFELSELNIIEDKPRLGFNVMTEQVVDMIDAGIVDAADVVMAALQNAVSIASMYSNTKCVMTNAPK